MTHLDECLAAHFCTALSFYAFTPDTGATHPVVNVRWDSGNDDIRKGTENRDPQYQASKHSATDGTERGGTGRGGDGRGLG